MTRTNLPLVIATLAGAVVLSLMLTVAALAQPADQVKVQQLVNLVQGWERSAPDGCYTDPPPGSPIPDWRGWLARCHHKTCGEPIPPPTPPVHAALYSHWGQCTRAGSNHITPLHPTLLEMASSSPYLARYLYTDDRDRAVADIRLIYDEGRLAPILASWSGPGPGPVLDPDRCCTDEGGAWGCDPIPADIRVQCEAERLSNGGTLDCPTQSTGPCESACYLDQRERLFQAPRVLLVDAPRCWVPPDGSEGEDDDDEDDDGEEPPPPPTECVCDLSAVNTQLGTLSEAVATAAEARAALVERQDTHDFRLDKLEQAVEELQEDEPEPPPPAECWTETERESALEAWALSSRTWPAGWDGARALVTIRAQPETNWHRRLLATHEATLPPVCEENGEDDQGEDVGGFLEVAPSCWPGPNGHCETTTRCTVHTWAIHGKVPLKPGLAAKRSCGTPNHRLLRAAERYLRTGESEDIFNELRVGLGAPLMGAEQGGYPPSGDYHLEGVVGAALVATAREDPEVLGAARDWLAAYCSYVELLSVAGESYIPGPRVQAEYGTDPVRDDTCAILAGTKRPRGGEWTALDFDAAHHLAAPLAGAITWSQADLPPVLSPLTVYIHQRGKVATVDEYVKAAGGPLWAVAVDRDGNKASVSWREAGATHWSCGRNAPSNCVPAKRWFGRQREIPAELDTSALDLGPVVEEWVLDTQGARRVR